MRPLRPLALVAALALLSPVESGAQRGDTLPSRPASRTARAPGADTARPARADSLGALKLRSIGPALTSGRISDVAVHPRDPKTWYVAVAAGGVWKTTNAGTTFEPVFDAQGSYSIGVVVIDSQNPNTIWVGTGENNAQRSVSYGDGVYKSTDGGRSWQNVGLKESEHIGKIVIDPRNSDVVYVAAQGPLWRKGGDRGVYRTSDGGKTWARVLHVDDWTGANDIVLDPRNPDILVATMWQRHRRVWTFIGGGPGSGVHRSIDGGRTWTKSQKGLPSDDLGRVGLAVSPVNPDVVYAIVDAGQQKGGFFRSGDGGMNWERMGAYQSGGNYYNEIFADPHDVDRVYAVDVFLQVTEDGGRTFRRVGERQKHVDNHLVWIDPADVDHLLVGSDGGLYESFDRGKTYRFFANLPVTQFYKVATDQNAPFYKVYGGTQDNFSLGGPSRTRTAHGIQNSDWFVTQGGDGFQTVVDPTDPNTVYAQLQHGVLSRFDLRTGQATYIQPQEEAGDQPLRWNWDSPLIVSPHSPTRLYFAANRVFRTDDRGDSWRPVSGDLTRQIDRNRLRTMDRVWHFEALGKNASTSFYGNIVALAESPLKEGLLWAGTDDGLIQVSEDGGATWRAIPRVAGVPDTTYVTDLEPSRHEVNTVYATFANYKSGDFRPYVMKSTDLGRTWRGIAANLPERGSTFTIVEDHVDPKLLFVGTEFGVHFTNDGGGRWLRLRSGIPTIQVRDLVIQRQMDDLVVGTFGRGMYVLDDYSPLRTLVSGFTAEAALAPVRKAWLYVPASPLGLPGVAFQGAAHYAAENPAYGATFTYRLRDSLTSRRTARRDRERAAIKAGRDTPYPSWDSLRVEDREEEPTMVLTISDAQGRPIRRLTGPTTAGMHRVTWDLRLQPVTPVNSAPFRADPDNPWVTPPLGPQAVPGTYTVALAKRVDGVETAIGAPQRFEVVTPDGESVRPAAALALQQEGMQLQRAMLGTDALLGETLERVRFLKRAIDEASVTGNLGQQVRALEQRVLDVRERLSGDPTRARRNEPTPASLIDRLNAGIVSSWQTSLGAPTATAARQLAIAREGYAAVATEARALVETELPRVETAAEQAGVPWTPGRIPTLPRP